VLWGRRLCCKQLLLIPTTSYAAITLSYEIWDINGLNRLPGWETLPKRSSTSKDLAPDATLCVVLEAPTTAIQPPQPWNPVRVSSAQPANLLPNQIALRGRANYSRVEYGLETYYILEDQRVQINQDIRKDQQRCPRQETMTCKLAIVVEAKASADGTAIPTNLWIESRDYRF
jgi:uncharacterized membrane-anchored protein